jgi:hypothetical protein
MESHAFSWFQRSSSSILKMTGTIGGDRLVRQVYQVGGNSRESVIRTVVRDDKHTRVSHMGCKSKTAGHFVENKNDKHTNSNQLDHHPGIASSNDYTVFRTDSTNIVGPELDATAVLSATVKELCSDPQPNEGTPKDSASNPETDPALSKPRSIRVPGKHCLHCRCHSSFADRCFSGAVRCDLLPPNQQGRTHTKEDRVAFSKRLHRMVENQKTHAFAPHTATFHDSEQYRELQFYVMNDHPRYVNASEHPSEN